MIRQTLAKLKRKDALLWSADVGRMHSRNNIKVKGDNIFVSTSGQNWNAPDPTDGVYCISSVSGAVLWFFPTQSDANELQVFDDLLLVGTDEGTIFAIDTKSGQALQKFSTDTPVYTRAIELRNGEKRTAIIVSKYGDVIQYELDSREFSVLGNLPHVIRSNPIAVTPSSFVVGAESGAVVFAEIAGSRLTYRTIFQLEGHKASGSPSSSVEVRGISSLLLANEKVIISYSRDTYDRRPPITCFSIKTGAKIWDAGRIQSASRGDKEEFGNSRITPAIWGDVLVSTFSYNESVHAFSMQSGKWMWRLRLDDSYFQNWSSPVIHEDKLYVARVNGVLSVLDLRERRVLASYSVEVMDVGSEDDHPASEIDRDATPWPNKLHDLENSGPYPGQPLMAGICSTPVVLADRILIGTISGRLCCLRQIGR